MQGKITYIYFCDIHSYSFLQGEADGKSYAMCSFSWK